MAGVVTAALGQVDQGPKPPGGNSNGGGGVGLGITIDVGTIFNAIRNLRKSDEPPKPPTLQKKAVTVSSGASGSYTIDWVVQYANNTGATLPSATIVDGPIATIIPGSLQQPPEWTGTTNSTPPPDNFAKWTGANVAPHGVMTATFQSSAGGVFSVSGAGDGYQPIPYTHPSGPRIYFMNHHEAPGAASFDCVDTATGKRCSGSWPRKLPFGDGKTDSSGTSGNNSEYVIDGSKFYYPAQNFSKWGIGCFDLNNDTECGFTLLGEASSSSKPPQAKTMLQGPWLVNGELYLASHEGQIYCAKLNAALDPCLKGGYKIPLTTIKLKVPNPSSDALDWRNGLIAGKVVGNRLYFTSFNAWYVPEGPAKSKFFNCIKADSSTKAACWSGGGVDVGTGASVELPPSSFGTNASNYIYYDANGNALAICTRYGTAPKQKCTNLADGKPMTLPDIFSPTMSQRLSHSTHVWPRTYFTESTGYSYSGVFQAWCWDWKDGKNCNANDSSFSDGPKATGDYGNNVDAQGCIWTYGHNSILWSYDPNNIDPSTKKALPCGGSGGKSASVFQPLQYCSGPKPFRWLNVEVKGATLSNYTKFIVKVLDSTSNAVLLTKDLLPSGPTKVDISSLDAQTISKPLKIEIEYTPKSGATDKPYLEVRYDAPPAEFCFKSKHTCSQKSISNIVETPDPAKPQNMVSVTVNVPAPQNCVVVDPPVCGQPGQPPCPTCGTPNTPPCSMCGQPGQPPCPVCGTATTPPCNNCGLAGQPPCVCIPGTAGCPPPPPPPPPVCAPGSLGWPACMTCTTPPCGGVPRVVIDEICLTPPCADKPKQSVIDEFKEPKAGCVRKTKPAADASDAPKPKALVKPKPKPVAAAPVTDAAPRPAVSAPKPKPRPPAKPKQKTDQDDCE